MGNLNGRSALVTGGSRGIGRAIAQALSIAGCDVTIIGRTQASIDRAVADGVAERGICLDVGDTAALYQVLKTLASHQAVDILVNNAGTAISRPFDKQDTAAFLSMLTQHVLAPAEAARALLPGMKARAMGRIINIGSTASVKGYAYLTAYVAAKHAMLGLTRALALEVARTGVTVNCICPGFVATDLVMDGMAARAAKEARPVEVVLADFSNTKPQGRLVDPSEIAAAVLWLVSDAAAAVTGQAIMVDGGESIA